MIGIHYGEFVGGFVGTKVLRFDIWGPDVMIARYWFIATNVTQITIFRFKGLRPIFKGQPKANVSRESQRALNPITPYVTCVT